MTSQNNISVWSRTTGPVVLRPEDVLGSGGEGAVYKLRNTPDMVAKIYHSNKLTADVVKKLEVMIEHPPRTEDDETGHLLVSWPKDTVHDGYGGPVIGFLMPTVEKTSNLFEYYLPHLRRVHAPQATYAILCLVAKSLATALDRIHGISYAYIVGDINESNAYITEDEQVTLIDADSFQITDSRTIPPTVHRCMVGKPEYTPPELQGTSFRDIDRNVNHDKFALAVIIYQLLMEGTHPFRGVYTGQGNTPPSVETSIANGYFLYSANASRSVYKPAPTALPWGSLTAKLRNLFLRCFDEGHTNPDMRPSPREWADALDEAIQDLLPCNANASHWYFGGQSGVSGSAACTWCERKATLGLESFPERLGAHRYALPAPGVPALGAGAVLAPGVSGVPAPGASGGRLPKWRQLIILGRQLIRLPLWRQLFRLAIIVFWGGPRSTRPLWLKLAGAAVGVYLVFYIVFAILSAALSGINTFEERFIWPLFADDATAVVATPTPEPSILCRLGWLPSCQPTPAPAAPAFALMPTSTPTLTPTALPTHTPVPLIPTGTAIPTLVPAAAPNPTDTPMLTPPPTATHTPLPTSTHTPVPTDTPTQLPTSTATPTPLPTSTPTLVPTSTPTPLPTHTPVPTNTPTHTPIPCVHFGPGTDLNRCDLSGKDLRGFNLTGASLSYANLTGTNLKDAVLTNATIAGAVVVSVTLTNVNLSTTDITDIRAFDKAILVRVTFPVGVDLSDASFIDADLSRSSIVSANLERADFTGAKLYRADLTGAALTEANFRRADLDGAVLDGANLQGANLASADLSEIYFDINPDFRAADLRNANFFKATLNGVDFSGAQLEEAKFDRAEMSAAIFDNAELNEADMKDANLRGARFNGADVSDVNFSEADLSNASFQWADIEDTRFSEANLTGAIFSGAINADKAMFSDTICSDGSTSDSCYFEGRLHGIRP